MASAITLEHVSKRYRGGQIAVGDLSLEVGEGELCALVGPSGSGKTTTLKMVNRLIEPSSGRILLGGENVLELDPVTLRRRIGYVMQQGGLFPHQRIAENVGTVPRLLGWPKQKIRSRVEELLELVGLDPASYSRRYPHELSGGERQRVGVARALGADPEVLLMDEPFGAVDPITRVRLQDEFLALQLHKTVIFVTHDIEEAVKLGTRIAVFSGGGVLEQYASPAEVVSHPASSFVAEFVGGSRDLELLAVTAVTPGDLVRVPTVQAGTSGRGAAAALEAAGAPLGVLVTRNGVPLGIVHVAEAAAAGSGDVGAIQRALATPLRVGSTLKAALAELLRSDDGVLAVVDADGAYLGVLRVEDVHGAIRRSLNAPVPAAATR